MKVETHNEASLAESVDNVNVEVCIKQLSCNATSNNRRMIFNLYWKGNPLDPKLFLSSMV